MMRTTAVTVILCSLALCGCSGDKSESAAPAVPASAHAEAGQAAAPAPSGDAIDTDRLSFHLPAGWERSAPKSSMRIAQASIPGAAGAAELAVFYFGVGQGGGVDPNIRRWIGQIEPAEGTTPTREHFQANEFTVTWVDVAGTLKPSAMGMGPSEAKPNSRLLGAVVEGPGGPWFFKATGPDATLAAQRPNFLAMLHHLRSK
jgi:hypothetical protein